MIPSFEQRHSIGYCALYRGSSAPDTSKQQEAAVMTAQLSQEQLDWAKEIYRETAPDREAAAARANEVSDVQLQGMRKQIALGDEYAERTRTVFNPLEDSIVRDAQNFDTEAERERLAGMAIGDVTLAGANARAMGERALTRSGINPNDGAYAAHQDSTNTALALGQADAANRSRSSAMTLGRALKMDAAALGRGLPGSSATAASLAMNQGNSSVANAGGALAPGQNAQIALGGAYSGARQGYGQAANIYGNISSAENGASAANGQAMGAAGAAIGGIAIAI